MKTLKRFAGAREAVAAVEFALILPLLLALYVGSVEMSTAFAFDKRVASVSGSLGDLVARTNGTISQSTLDDYFEAASAIMTPYSSASVRQVVSVVYVDSDGKTSIKWSKSYNGGTARTAGDSYSLPTELTDIARDKYVVVSETWASFTPTIGYAFNQTIPLYHEFYHLARYGDEIKYSST